jgi:hypothetical protein
MNTVIKYLQKINSIALLFGSNGSALIATIVTITVVATLAAGIASILSSSSTVPAGADLSTKAFYFAESGIRYMDPPDSLPVEAAVNGSNGCMNQSNPSQCLQNLASCINQPTTTCLQSFPSLNQAYKYNTYTLDNGNTTIAMGASYIAGPPQTIRITSTSTVSSGTSSESKQTLTYNVAAQAQTASTYNEHFNSTGNWTPVIGSVSTPQSFTVSGVTFNAEAPSVSGGSSKEALISLNNSGQSVVNLVNNGLANYSVQVKCKAPSGKGYAVGVSFQLNGSDGSSYGVSFLGGGGLASNSPLAPALGPLPGNGNLYIILWKVDSTGTYTLLDYKQAATSDGITTDGQTLTDWSTLIVQLQQYTVAGSTKNEINVFVQGPASYAPGTAIVWNLTSFNPVTWNCPGTSPVTVQSSQISCGSSTTWSTGVTHNLLDMVVPTTSNGHYYECRTAGTSGTTQPAWPTGYHLTVTDGTVQWTESRAFIDGSLTPNPPQIGLHLFFHDNSEQAYFADFSVQGASSASSGGSTSY